MSRLIRLARRIIRPRDRPWARPVIVVYETSPAAGSRPTTILEEELLDTPPRPVVGGAPQ